jgi:putative ABC transport system permease protein
MTTPTSSSPAPRTSFGTRSASRWEPLWHDVRYAARGLRRKPAFTAAVVITLGLGIGANATMFSIVDRLLFRPPAYVHAPDRVHRVNLVVTTERDGDFIAGNMSYKRYVELTEWTRAFDVTAAMADGYPAIGLGENAREMNIEAVSASFWRLFDMKPALGRFFTPDEDRVPDGTQVVVLGYGFWQSSYGGRADVLGESVQIGSETYTIIGVAPKDFVGVSLSATAAFLPITAWASASFGARAAGDGPFGGRRPNYYDVHNIQWMEMLARRKPGVSVSAASTDLSNAYRRSYIAHKVAAPSIRPTELAKPRALASPLMRERGPRQGNDSKVATWLVGVAVIVLLIACANVSNLLLARAFGRRREIAVRLALGVSRARLLRQLITESLLLAALGAVAGLALAQWGGGILRGVLLENVDWKSTFGDARVLTFTLAAAVVAGLLTGLAPALHAAQGDIAATLKAGAREGTYQRSRTRVALLVMQGALSVVLLVGAGLFVRSLRNVHSLDLGYDGSRVTYTEITMRGVKLDSIQSGELRRRLLEAATSLPFVEAGSRTVTVPFWSSITQDLHVAGIDSVDRLGDFYFHAVSPDYFKTMGTRLRRGRAFTAADTRNAPLVMIVSESMAKKLWPGHDAIGQCVRVGEDTVPCTQVVGMAQDIRRETLSHDDGLQYYLPIDQLQRGIGGGLFIRARGKAKSYAEALRRELQKTMPGASYLTVTPLDDILGSQTRSWTLGATMFTVFGLLALLVAAVGLYSVIAYNVAQRTHELGVRVALGARTADVVRLVVGEGIRVSLTGIAIGSIVALAAARYVGPLLFGVSPKDPAVFSTVAAVLIAVALAASVAPAWRASRVDPSVALRGD